MLDDFVLMFCRSTIALVFALTAFGKALDVAAFQESISEFRILPMNLSKAAAWILLGTELVVVLLMVAGGYLLSAGFSLAVCLLATFSAALLVALWRTSKMICSCFGIGTQRISPYDVARNVLLALCCLIGICALDDASHGLPGSASVLVILMAISFVCLVSNLRDVVETLRQPFSPLR